MLIFRVSKEVRDPTSTPSDIRGDEMSGIGHFVGRSEAVWILQPNWETFAAQLVRKFWALKQPSFSTGKLGQRGKLTCFQEGKRA